MQFLFIISSIGLPFLTWMRWRSVIHPSFVTTVAVSVLLLSDFAVRGNNDPSLKNIASFDLVYFQSLLLFAAAGMALTSNFTAAYLSHSTALIRRQKKMSILNNRAKLHEFLRYSAVIAWVIVTIEFLKIFSACDWSMSEVSKHFFGGYSRKPWEMKGTIGGWQSIYQITRLVMPFAGLGFASGLVLGSRERRLTSLLGLISTLALMFSHGSRTPLFATIGFLLAGFVLREKNGVKRLAIIGVTGLCIAATTSILYQHRATGLKHVSLTELLTPNIHYRQDDSAYRALRCMNIATHSTERWAPVKFLAATIANPIPRYFWAQKPILLQSYWGRYKVEWVTITAVGEFTAMFGPFVGSCCTVLLAIPLTLLLCRYHSRIVVIPDVFIYMVICLYCYMIIRSLLNFGMYVYLPAFAVLFQAYIARRANQSRQIRSRSIVA